MRMSTPLFLLLFATASLSMTAPAQAGPVSQAGYHKEIDSFMERMSKYEGAAAVTEVLGQNPWVAPAALVPLQKALASHKDQLGEYYGHEILDEVQVGDRLAVVTVLARYDRQPVTVEFTYYRPNKKWRIQALNVYADWADRVQEAARERRLTPSAQP